MSNGNPKGKSRAVDSDLLALDMGAAEEGKGGGAADGGFMQMQLVEQQVGGLALRQLDEAEPHVIGDAGYIHTISGNCHRVDRIHNCGARPDLHPVGPDGCGTKGDSAAD